jgi:hypothetical protein
MVQSQRLIKERTYNNPSALREDGGACLIYCAKKLFVCETYEETKERDEIMEVLTKVNKANAESVAAARQHSESSSSRNSRYY